jgi:hypothetical protein
VWSGGARFFEPSAARVPFIAVATALENKVLQELTNDSKNIAAASGDAEHEDALRLTAPEILDDDA